MIVNKNFEARINISAADQFLDMNTVIIDSLRRYFVGRNKDKSFILDIEKIIHRSTYCTLDKSKSDGSGNIAVTYQAKVLVYMPGDILSACEILRIDKQQITCRFGPHVLVMIKGDRNMPQLKVGDLIPAVARKVEYLPVNKEITIIASMYTGPPTGTIVYTVAEKAPVAEDVVILAAAEKELTAALAEYATMIETKADVVAAIESGYFPYKSHSEAILMKLVDVKVHDNWDAISIKPGMMLTRPVFVNKGAGTVIEITDQKAMHSLNTGMCTSPVKIVREPAVTIRLAFIADQLAFIRLVLSMVGPNEAKYNKIWGRAQAKPVTFLTEKAEKVDKI
jgi:hypothetical protein